MEPTIATVVTNPTNRDLKYQFLGAHGMFVKAGCTVTLPYDVFTAATSGQKAQLGQALKTKMVKVTYETRLPVKKVKTIKNGVVHTAKTKKAKKAEETSPDPAPAPATKAARDKKVEEDKKAREEIIVSTGEGKDAEEALKDSEDLVQKFTGQETTTMRDAMGWEDPATDDPRTPQELETVKMNDAASENVGDPEEKAAAAAKKETSKKKSSKKKWTRSAVPPPRRLRPPGRPTRLRKKPRPRRNSYTARFRTGPGL